MIERSRVFLGTLLLIAGIAAHIEAGSHAPGRTCFSILGPGCDGPSRATGWSQNAYDLVRIGSWTLIVTGVVLLLVGLIAYRTTRAPGAMAGGSSTNL